MSTTDRPSALAECETCGMPVRVVFDDEGKIAEVFAVCGHAKKPDDAEARGVQDKRQERG